jgi:cyclopropane-fatty-acyl-phospholipid synthase
MKMRTSRVDTEAARSLFILKLLLKDHHPRDYAFRLWDGSVWEAEAGQPVRFTMVIRHAGSLRTMFLGQSENAMGQAYVYDDFDVEGSMESAVSMAEHLFQLRLGVGDRLRLATQLLRLPSQQKPRAGRQAAILDGTVHSIERDRQAVTYHYNTSNDFFSLYLDKRMVYSCAYFESPDEDLESAQKRKLDYICRKLRLEKGDHLLDIGCGWGGLIIYAAKKYKISALGITLSEPQAKLANERIKKAGLSDRCLAEVRDYRQIAGTSLFGKIASIGMVEHVGEPMLPEYFRHVWRLLRPGGVFLNHGIAHPHLATRGQSFSQAYIFPDGEPVPIHVSTRIAEKVGFEVRDVESLREHYMLTARHWVRRLEAHHDEAVRATDEATYRAWRLYMSAAASQFAAGKYNVYQSLLVKPDRGNSGLPLTRSDWYKEHSELAKH